MYVRFHPQGSMSMECHIKKVTHPPPHPKNKKLISLEISQILVALDVVLSYKSRRIGAYIKKGKIDFRRQQAGVKCENKTHSRC